MIYQGCATSTAIDNWELHNNVNYIYCFNDIWFHFTYTVYLVEGAIVGDTRVVA